MNTKDNRRSRLTRMLLKDAYLNLMREKPTAKITVKDICEGADVNRSTFYLYYSEPNDLLMELENETIFSVSNALRSIGAINGVPADARECLLSFLRYVRKNEELFRTLLIENNDPHFRRKLQTVALDMATTSISFENEPEDKEAVFLFIVSGSLELLTEWLRNGCSEPEASLCEFLYRVSEGCLKNICG